jgi:hypothetical protein
MLSVVARFAPDHGRGRVLHRQAIECHRLAVALHVELLQVGREAPQTAVVRENRVRRQLETVDVPHAEQTEQRRQVALPGRRTEMLVHVVTAGQELEERVATDRDGERYPDRRPHRVPAAHPVPHHEAIVRIDAEGVHRAGVGGNSREVRGHGRLAEPVGQPSARAARIGQRFLGRESLRCDDEERACRIRILEHVGEIRTVDVRDEQHARRADRERMQRLDGHRGTEVRAADADVDDGAERLTARTPHRPRAHVSGECQHALAFREHLSRDGFTAGPRRRDAGHAQRGVQHRPALGGVYRVAPPHRVDAGAQTRGVGQAREQTQAVAVDPLPGIIEVETAGLAGEVRRACRIGITQGAQWHGAGFGGARLHGTPGGGQCVVGHPRIRWGSEGGDVIDNPHNMPLNSRYFP